MVRFSPAQPKEVYDIFSAEDTPKNASPPGHNQCTEGGAVTPFDKEVARACGGGIYLFSYTMPKISAPIFPRLSGEHLSGVSEAVCHQG